jgi:DNA-binding response OmpR family regulator
MIDAPDEEVFAGSLQRLLFNGYDATVVTSGRAALEQLCAGEAPGKGMSALDLHTELRRRAPETAERIIFLTGGAVSRRAQQFLETIGLLASGHWFEKPCNLQELRAAIRRQIARSRGM